MCINSSLSLLNNKTDKVKCGCVSAVGLTFAFQRVCRNGSGFENLDERPFQSRANRGIEKKCSQFEIEKYLNWPTKPTKISTILPGRRISKDRAVQDVRRKAQCFCIFYSLPNIVYGTFLILWCLQNIVFHFLKQHSTV